jgi:hypothetical protein
MTKSRKDLLKEKIVSAFKEVIYPGEDLGSPDIEIEDFLEKDWISWQDIPKEIIDRNIDELSFFSPKGYQFVLPAYMTFSLDDMHETLLVDYTVSSLTRFLLYRETENYAYHIFMNRVLIFTTEQIKSIICFLKFAETEIFIEHPNQATEALNRYWSKIDLE